MCVAALAGCGGGAAEPQENALPVSAPHGRQDPRPDRALKAGEVLKALPELRSMPVGWTTGIERPAVREIPEEKWCREDGGARDRREDGGPRDCSMFRISGRVQYKAPGDTGSVYISLLSYPDRRTAATAFKNSSAVREGDRAMSMPAVGDESATVAHPRAPYATPSTETSVRVGTAVAHLIYQDAEKSEDHPRVLLALARMQAQRLLQAEQGRVPDATATLG